MNRGTVFARVRRRLTWSLGLGAWALLACGCANLGSTPADAISGRLAVQVSATVGQAARQFSTGFELRGTSQEGELDLTSPLGTVLAQARWRPGRVEWSSAEGRFEATDLDALAERTLGQRLPLAALFDWLRGRPWPAAAHTLNAQGFEQLGWMVDLQGWGQRRLVARREAAPQITVRASLEARP